MARLPAGEPERPVRGMALGVAGDHRIRRPSGSPGALEVEGRGVERMAGALPVFADGGWCAPGLRGALH